MKLSPRALKWTAGAAFTFFVALVAESEGLRTSAYKDVAGITTICYGHTGPDVAMGMKLTQAECDKLLAKDSEWAWMAVDELVKVDMEPWQWIALSDWTVNFGKGALKSSTMLKTINGGDWINGCRMLLDWVYAGPPGKKVKYPGLVKRRQKEYLLCMGYAFDGYYDSNHRPLMSRLLR